MLMRNKQLLLVTINFTFYDILMDSFHRRIIRPFNHLDVKHLFLKLG